MHRLDEFSRGASPVGEGPDSGVSLIEVLVSMVVMSIAMVIFTGGIIQTYGAMQKTEAMSTTQRSATTAFQRMDREMRYASQVNTVWPSGNDHYVEYLMTNSGTSTCVQLRTQASSKSLQRRQWTRGGTPPAAWQTLIANVVPANPLSPSTSPAPTTGSVSPFVLIPADTVSMFQKLQVNLRITVGGNKNAANRQLSVTFTALNSPPNAPVTPVPLTCTEGRTP